MSGRRGNRLQMIRLSIMKVRSTTSAVAASATERSISITIPKSTKQALHVAKGWARLILRCCSHSKHSFLKKSLSMLSCTMTIGIRQEQGARLPSCVWKIFCPAGGWLGTSVLFWERHWALRSRTGSACGLCLLFGESVTVLVMLLQKLIMQRWFLALQRFIKVAHWWIGSGLNPELSYV